MTTILIRNRKDEIVAELEVEGATATPPELEAHYTHFARVFMRHLGYGLKASVQ